MTAAPGPTNLVVLIPVHDDWASLERLVPELDAALAAATQPGQLLLVDDGSPTPVPAGLLAAHTLRAISRVEVLRLRRNLGHQRAIAVGLAYLHEQVASPTVVIMDADGEDRPADVPRLLEAFARTEGRSVVFAERLRRSEGPGFTIGYHLYRLLHRALTGIAVRVGNFSVLPPAGLAALVTASELWSHYAAAVFKLRLPRTLVPTIRGTRYAGRSRMDVTGLMVHGLSAIAVFGDRVGARLLIVVALLVAADGLALAGLLLVRLGTRLTVPPWAAPVSGLLLLVLLQLALMVGVLVFLVLGARSTAIFLPIRDYRFFVHSTSVVTPT